VEAVCAPGWLSPDESIAASFTKCTFPAALIVAAINTTFGADDG